MKKIFAFLLLMISSTGYGQTDVLNRFLAADSLMQSNHFSGAYKILKDIEAKSGTKDTLYPDIIWSYTHSATQLEKSFRDKQQFDSSLYYGMDALRLIAKGKPLFDEQYANREYWMVKNIIVSCFGLGQLENAKKYKVPLTSFFAVSSRLVNT